MKRREAAVRAAVKKLDMPQAVKDILIDIWREVDGAYAEQVDDLKTRLKVLRVIGERGQFRYDPRHRDLYFKATNLRRKNWRKT